MRRGAKQVGLRSQLCSPIVAEAIGSCGFDYVYLDMEHSPNDLMSVMQQSQAVSVSCAHTLVRLPVMNAILIQQLMDCGLENIVVPMVETEEQARAAVEAMRYPPRGNRGVAKVHRGNGYSGQPNYLSSIDDRVCLIAQIETRKALENMSAIAAVDGIHALLFGPADLAADLGYIEQANHPVVMEAIASGIAAARKAGVFAGMSTGSGEAARAWFERGCQFVSVGGDLQILVDQARAFERDAHVGLSG